MYVGYFSLWFGMATSSSFLFFAFTYFREMVNKGNAAISGSEVTALSVFVALTSFVVLVQVTLHEFLHCTDYVLIKTPISYQCTD